MDAPYRRRLANKQWLKTSEFADVLGVSQATVQGWIRAGYLAAYVRRSPGGQALIDYPKWKQWGPERFDPKLKRWV